MTARQLVSWGTKELEKKSIENAKGDAFYLFEFITGIFVNKIMHWNVWDYTDQPFQLMGQICLPFTIIFSGLCAVGILLSGYLLHFLYGEKKPEFHVL